MAQVKLVGFRCERCGHEWLPREKNQEPRVCPKCKSPYWNRPRQADRRSGKLVGQFDSNQPAIPLAGPGWIEDAIQLEASGKQEESLDVIFDHIDEMLLASDFDGCSRLLDEIATNRLTYAQLLTVLTATLPAKNLLSSRKPFFDRVKSLLQSQGADSTQLLMGLE